MTAGILMPKLGLTMTEGLLAAWRVRPGDAVAEGDLLFVVETEKIATDVEAQTSGRIQTLEVQEGEVVPVGTVVATWSDGSASPAGGGTPSKAASPEAVPPRTARREASDAAMRVIATPLARRVARKTGVDLASLAGSGPGGRIKVRDVEVALATRAASPLPPPPADAARSGPAGRRRPLTATERVVARRLTEAKQSIPHFYVGAEADVTRLLDLRSELNGHPGAPRISLTHFVVAALGRALRSHPDCNVVWDADEVLELDGCDVGVATDTDRGLLVPVVRNVDRLSLDGVAEATAALVATARAGRLAPSEVSGGALSVSNVGMVGASRLTPIINPGQSAILGVAAVRPVFRPDQDGKPLLRQELSLVLSCDHRVLDGVKAARFLDASVRLLEQPLSLLRGAAGLV